MCFLARRASEEEEPQLAVARGSPFLLPFLADSIPALTDRKEAVVREAARSEAFGRAPRIFFSAGEPSGDLHGANLIRALQERCPGIRCEGFGGELMEASGCRLL